MLIEDETLRAASLQLVQRLREAGGCVDYPLAPAKSDKQFKRALDLGARRVVRLEAGADGSHRVWVKRAVHPRRTRGGARGDRGRDGVLRTARPTAK